MKHRTKKRTPMNRSQMMQAVHSEDTKPEILVRRALFKAGLRYQHGCKFTSRPKSNPEFWNDKFTNNAVRDIKTNWKLSLQGYRVATVWECSIKNDFDRTIERLKTFITSDEETIEI